MLRTFRAALAAVALLAPASAGPAAAQQCGTQCGAERWAVKTLTDADRSRVSFTPVDETVSALRALAHPQSLPTNGRFGPVELTTYTVHAVLLGWLLEGDRDMHLVIAEPTDTSRTMIAEVPSTTCQRVCSSGHLRQIRAVRRALLDRLGYPKKKYAALAQPLEVTVTGVGFFDFAHHQTGLAPNAIELHPVLGIEFSTPSAPPR